MKKLIVAVVTAGMFAAYSLGVRHHSLGQVKQVATSAAGTADMTAGTTSSTSANGAAGGSGSSSGSNPSTTSTTPATTTTYKDGNYTGSVEDAYYGDVQVAVTVAAGKITKVSFLQYPHTHSTSVMLNQFALPGLRQEAIKAQSSDVQVISGATFTSQAFMQSLATALNQAKNS